MSASTSRQMTPKAARRRARLEEAAAVTRRQERRRQLRNWLAAGLAVTLVIAGLYAIFRTQADSNAAASQPGDYQVGSPGPGDPAPDFTLPDTTGKDVRFSELRGRSVLLYFHEGLGCQPCWDQIRDLERESTRLQAAGVDELVSITNAPTDLLARKMRDDGLRSRALADPDLTVIREFDANKYGMMGDTTAGHSFILVGPDGQILWRADYGGAPNYTMYLPVDKILADMEAGRTDA